MKLASANVFDAPLIDPNFLSDPEGHDLQVLSEVVDLARSIARSDAMAGVVDAELSPSGTAFAADGSEARSEEMLRFLCAHNQRVRRLPPNGTPRPPANGMRSRAGQK